MEEWTFTLARKPEKPSSHCLTKAKAGFTFSDLSQVVRCLLCKEQNLYGQSSGKCPVCLYLIFAESVLVLSALSTCDLGHFKCETAWMKVSTPESEAMVFCQKTADHSAWVRNELMQFKYLGSRKVSRA